VVEFQTAILEFSFHIIPMFYANLTCEPLFENNVEIPSDYLTQYVKVKGNMVIGWAVIKLQGPKANFSPSACIT